MLVDFHVSEQAENNMGDPSELVDGEFDLAMDGIARHVLPVRLIEDDVEASEVPWLGRKG